MWSSRISILKTVLEMADIWQFANKKKTNLSARWSARTELWKAPAQSKDIS